MTSVLSSTGTVRLPDQSGKQAMQDLKNATVDTLLATASAVVADIAESSNVFNPVIEEKMPRFHHKEVSFGHILGRGGFCVVREVERIKSHSKSLGTSNKSVKKKSGCGFIFRLTKKTMDEESDHYDRNDLDNGESPRMNDLKFSRDFIASRSKKSRSRGGGRYVVKAVSNDLDKITYMKGHVDIALEAKFLSALDHPNIIELAAVSTTDSCHPDFFLILERMTGTLTNKIKSWMDRDRLNQGVTSIFTGGKKKVEALYRERIGASYDIASGLYYLHSKNVIFRDLKPDNIGFDTNGVLKIYDFGLAKELLNGDRMKDGLYKNLTGLTGAIRYMAPEVGLGKPYNLYADVYSWAMVMWFILALEPPFGFFTEDMIQDRVFKRGTRPAIFKRWNETIGELMRASWDVDIKSRPSFLEISLLLKQELIDCDGLTVMTGSSANSSVDSDA